MTGLGRVVVALLALALPACTGSSGPGAPAPTTSPSTAATPSPTSSVVSSAAVHDLVGADAAVSRPDPPRARTGVRVVVTGVARAGRHLSATCVTFGDGTGINAIADCVASPPAVPQTVQPFRAVLEHRWRRPGTYDVTVTLGALCVDAPDHRVTFSLVVEP